MNDNIKISEVFPVSAKRLYDAWLNSEEHSEFTGTKTIIRPTVGSKFYAGNDYITGSNITLQPYGRIVQTWRAKDFPAGAIESRLEILFEGLDTYCDVSLNGEQIFSSNNMFREWLVDVKDYVKQGENELIIYFQVLGLKPRTLVRIGDKNSWVQNPVGFSPILA